MKRRPRLVLAAGFAFAFALGLIGPAHRSSTAQSPPARASDGATSERRETAPRATGATQQAPGTDAGPVVRDPSVPLWPLTQRYPPPPVLTNIPAPAPRPGGRRVYVIRETLDVQGEVPFTAWASWDDDPRSGDEHYAAHEHAAASADDERAAQEPALASLERAADAVLEDPARGPAALLRLARAYRTVDRGGECAVPVLRHVLARAAADPAHAAAARDELLFQLGLALRDRGDDGEAALAMRALACPALGEYAPVATSAASLAPSSDAPPPRCAGLLARLERLAPTAGPGAAVDSTDLDARLAPGVPASAARAPTPAPLPTVFRACAPMPGADGRPSRRAATAWYYVARYFFDAPMQDYDRQNGLAAAALERCVDDAASPVYRHALLLLSHARWRRTDDYPAAAAALVRLLDVEAARADTDGTRLDGVALWRLAIVLTETVGWGPARIDDGVRCQDAVEQLAAPDAAVTRPFECAAIERLAAPFRPLDLLRAPDPSALTAPPGATAVLPAERPWLPALWRAVGDVYFTQTRYYEAIATYALYVHRYPTAPGAVAAAVRIGEAYDALRAFDSAADARLRLADFLERVHALNPLAARRPADRAYPRFARFAAATALLVRVPAALARAAALRRCVAGESVADVCVPARTRAGRAALLALEASASAYAEQVRARAIAAGESFVTHHPTDTDAPAMREALARVRPAPAP